jgi:hypothetical protein
VEVEFGGRTRTVRVTRDRLYTLLALPRVRDGLLTLRFTPGVAAYAFTFGAASERNSALGRRPVAPRALGAPVVRFIAPA